MLHDYWMYRPDPDLVRAIASRHPRGSGVVWSHEQPDGLLEKLPWWSFIDWVSSGEIPTYDAHSESCVTTLEYLGALDGCRRSREEPRRSGSRRSRSIARASTCAPGIRNKCWAASRGLVADNADSKIFSQQANILAVLYDVVPAERPAARSCGRSWPSSREQRRTAS